jgi:hypothetical protein
MSYNLAICIYNITRREFYRSLCCELLVELYKFGCKTVYRTESCEISDEIFSIYTKFINDCINANSWQEIKVVCDQIFELLSNDGYDISTHIAANVIINLKRQDKIYTICCCDIEYT